MLCIALWLLFSVHCCLRNLYCSMIYLLPAFSFTLKQGPNLLFSEHSFGLCSCCHTVWFCKCLVRVSLWCDVTGKSYNIVYQKLTVSQFYLVQWNHKTEKVTEKTLKKQKPSLLVAVWNEKKLVNYRPVYKCTGWAKKNRTVFQTW